MAIAMPHGPAVPISQAVPHRQNVPHGRSNAPWPGCAPQPGVPPQSWQCPTAILSASSGGTMCCPSSWCWGSQCLALGYGGLGRSGGTRGAGGAGAARAQGRAGNPAAAAAGSSEAAASSHHTAWGWGVVLGGLSSMAPWPLVPWSSSHGPAAAPALVSIPQPYTPVAPSPLVPVPRPPQPPTPYSLVPSPTALGSQSCSPPSSMALQRPSLPPSWRYTHHLWGTTVGPVGRT